MKNWDNVRQDVDIHFDVLIDIDNDLDEYRDLPDANILASEISNVRHATEKWNKNVLNTPFLLLHKHRYIIINRGKIYRKLTRSQDEYYSALNNI